MLAPRLGVLSKGLLEFEVDGDQFSGSGLGVIRGPFVAVRLIQTVFAALI